MAAGTAVVLITLARRQIVSPLGRIVDGLSRMERGEKRYNFTRCDLVGLARETIESYRPHLQAGGFELECELPESPLST